MRAVVTMLAVLSLPALARAEAVDFNLVGKVLAGSRDKPVITISANEQTDGVEVVLTRDDGKVFKHKTGPLRPGATKSFPIPVTPGQERRFKGSMKVTVDGQAQSANFEFASEVVTPATITYDQVDLAAHTLVLKSTRETTKVELEVTSDEGQTLGQTEVTFDDAAAGAPLPVSWNQADGTVLKIAIKVHDPDGFYYGLELYPWRIDIPHEEVNFATNSFALDKSEEPKLDSSFEQISDAVARYGRWAEIKLYIAGHTDTVGDPRSNRTLSIKRARSISQHFRKKGLRVPIFYEGFGEEALKVATPDETDESRNRRADYVIAVEPPSIHGSASWKRLP